MVILYSEDEKAARDLQSSMPNMSFPSSQLQHHLGCNVPLPYQGDYPW